VLLHVLQLLTLLCDQMRLTMMGLAGRAMETTPSNDILTYTAIRGTCHMLTPEERE
jgi:hypothetical protein